MLALGTLFLFNPLSAHALELGGANDSININIHWDISASGAYTRDGGLNSSPGVSGPTVLAYAGGSTVALRLGGGGWFLLGLTSDYRLYNQVSSIDVAVGNMTGSRWNIVSPTIGIRTQSFIFKADYQFLGNLNLSNQTSNSATIAYGSPSGFRGTFLMPATSTIYFGAEVETVKFTQYIDSSTGTTTPFTPLNLFRAGLTASLVF